MKFADFVEVPTPSWERASTDRWVAITIELRDTLTGAVVRRPEVTTWGEGYAGMPANLEDDAPQTYLWQEGNQCCDCNRGLWFGQHPEVTGPWVCGGERFTMKLINPKDGTAFYDESTPG